MSKAVLISTKPRWCRRIEKGEKIIEVRKTKPIIKTPFKSLIYCTKDSEYEYYDFKLNCSLNGKVIGEFICDEIISYQYPFFYNETDCVVSLTKLGCLSVDEVWEYGRGKTLYGWHISDLKIYDKPKELSEFCKPCKNDCWNCKYYSFSGLAYDPSYCDWERYIESTGSIIKRPPQSWCYVEELR